MKKSGKSKKILESLKNNRPTEPTPEKLADSRPWQSPLFHALIVVAVGVIVYCKTITIPFRFDDIPYLLLNPAIRDFSFFADPARVLRLGINTDVINNFMLRPAAYLTFALNYALHGFDVKGYHLLNLLVHLGNGLLVYILARLTLRTPAMAASGDGSGNCLAERCRYLPLFCALLFTVHPLQTQAVTYIVQRFTSLCAFFLLGSLVLYVNARQSTRKSVRNASYLLSLAACVLAMLTKENAFTFPLVIALYEITFYQGKAVIRAARLLPYLMTMAIIPFNTMRLAMLAQSDQSETIGDAMNLVNFRGTSPLDYLMTQFGVITTYLRLLLIPINQNFDYDYRLQTNLFSPSVLLPLILLLAILGAGIWLLLLSRRVKNPVSGLHAITAFGIFWFFITLAVESSVIPIDDLIFEHRAYLPSVGFFLAALSGAASLHAYPGKGASMFFSRSVIGFLTLALIAYSIAGYKRNSIWGDKVIFWRDVVSKSPNKARSHIRLGLALLEEPYKEQGILEQLKANIDLASIGMNIPGNSPSFELQPNTASQKQVDEAINEFRTAVRLRPKWDIAHLNLGDALMFKGDFTGAAQEFNIALSLAPSTYRPYLSLGMLYEKKKDYSAARRYYLEAIRIAPNKQAPRAALAALYANEGKHAEALREYEIVWQLFPDEEILKKIDELRKSTQN